MAVAKLACSPIVVVMMAVIVCDAVSVTIALVVSTMMPVMATPTVTNGTSIMAAVIVCDAVAVTIALEVSSMMPVIAPPTVTDGTSMMAAVAVMVAAVIVPITTWRAGSTARHRTGRGLRFPRQNLSTKPVAVKLQIFVVVPAK